MNTRQQEQQRQTTEAHATAQQDIEQQIQQNASEQTTERTQAQSQVQQQRGEWNQAQEHLVTEARTEAGKAHQQGQQDIQKEQAQAQTQADQHIQDGNREVTEARQQGEQEAAKQRRNAEQESTGVFSWLAERARAFFNRFKEAIQHAFELARAAVRSAIQRAQQLAAAVIDRARQAIVNVIQRVGNLLISIGDRLLASFPGLRDRFRQAIQERVHRAVAKVNELADRLKQGVQRALNLLGAALDATLGLLERGLLAAVDAVNNAVQGAIRYANSVVQTFAAFAALIKDIAANPGQWLRNLGAAVMDGIRNHLWKAFKKAIKEWFNQKVEEVLGIGLTIFNILRSGGINLAKIGSMAWEAIKQAIPMALVQILIEKLVSMLIPAAGAVLAIIEGLQAAWGTVQRILQAIQRFIEFMKAVKTGKAGPKFADVLAAAAIAVIDFVANWLLKRLRKPAGAVASRLRAIAQRIERTLKRGVQAVRRGLSRVVGAIRSGGRALGRRLGRGLRTVGRVLGRTRLGRLAVRGFRAVGQRVQRLRQRFQAWRERRRQQREQRRQQTIQERVERVNRELRPKVHSLLERGISNIRLRGQLYAWRLQYGLRRLFVHKEAGNQIQFIAQVNPLIHLLPGFQPEGAEIARIVREIAEDMLTSPAMREQAILITENTRRSGGTPISTIAPGEGWPGNVSRILAGRTPPAGSERFYTVGQAGATELLIHERQAIRGYGHTNALVSTVTPQGTIRQFASYQDIATTLSSMGMRDQYIAGGMRTLISTGEMPPGFARRPGVAAEVASATYLITQRESIRNPATLVTAPATLTLIERGQLSFSQAFTGPNPAFPMAPEGAPAAARRAYEQLGMQIPLIGNRGESSLGSIESSQALLRREWNIVVNLVMSELRVRQLVFNDVSEARNVIRGTLESHIHSFLSP